MNSYQFEDILVGMQESFSRDITESMEESFSIISGDTNPLHRDDEFAVELSNGKFKKHVTYGLLTASLYSTLAGVYLPGKYSLIHSIEDLQFKNPVFSGDTLTVCGTVVSKQDDLRLIQVSAVIRNQDNKVVSKCKMKIIVQK